MYFSLGGEYFGQIPYVFPKLHLISSSFFSAKHYKTLISSSFLGICLFAHFFCLLRSSQNIYPFIFPPHSVPVNSDVSPLITKFLITCMSLISAALIFNMVSMNLQTFTKPVPRWLRTVVFVYVGPLVGYCCSDEARRLREEKEERR